MKGKTDPENIEARSYVLIKTIEAHDISLAVQQDSD